MPAVDLFRPSDPAFVAHPYDSYEALLRDRRLGRSYLHVAHRPAAA